MSNIDLNPERACRESQAGDYLLIKDYQFRITWKHAASGIVSLAAWALALWFVWWVISNAKADTIFDRADVYCMGAHAGHFNGPSKSKATDGAIHYALCVCRIAAERRMGGEQVENLHECEAQK